MRRSSKLTAVILLISAILFCMPVCRVLAYELPDPERSSSLSMTLKASDKGGKTKVASGASITCYLVAEMKTVNGAVTYELTEDYKASGLDLNSRIKQSTVDSLLEYTSANNIKGTTVKSGPDGKVVFEGLKAGVYLIAATSLPEGFTSFVPFLYYLPYYDTDAAEWIYEGTAEPKISYLSPVNIKVRKVWNDDGNNRPASVTVRLENEDGVYDTVTLNASNNWKHEWTNMRSDKKWSVKEINIPADYKATYSSNGLDFTITNTSQLIQTGQVQWPVPVMVFAGVFLICAGIIIRVPGKRKDEE